MILITYNTQELLTWSASLKKADTHINDYLIYFLRPLQQYVQCPQWKEPHLRRHQWNYKPKCPLPTLHSAQFWVTCTWKHHFLERPDPVVQKPRHKARQTCSSGYLHFLSLPSIFSLGTYLQQAFPFETYLDLRTKSGIPVKTSKMNILHWPLQIKYLYWAFRYLNIYIFQRKQTMWVVCKFISSYNSNSVFKLIRILPLKAKSLTRWTTSLKRGWRKTQNRVTKPNLSAAALTAKKHTSTLILSFMKISEYSQLT